MNDKLRDIQGYAAANRITITTHADRRARERGAKYEDIRHALMTAQTCKLEENGCYRVPSKDREGDELILIVALEGEDVVVTLF